MRVAILVAVLALSPLVASPPAEAVAGAVTVVAMNAQHKWLIVGALDCQAAGRFVATMHHDSGSATVTGQSTCGFVPHAFPPGSCHVRDDGSARCEAMGAVLVTPAEPDLVGDPTSALGSGFGFTRTLAGYESLHAPTLAVRA